MQISNQNPETFSSQPIDGGILHSAAELFSGRKGHSPEEKKVFLELAKNLLLTTSLRDRRQIANMLATHPDTPDELLEVLAIDEDPLTAYPVLRNSPHLSVDLLAEVVKTGPETARKAIAGRNKLTATVLTSLCDHGEADTIRLLLDREDLTLDHHFNERLSRRSDLIADLGQEMSSRQALSSEGLMAQFLYLPRSLRAKAIASAETMGLIKQAQIPEAAKIPALDTARLRLHGALLKAARLKKRTRFADSLGQGLSLPSSVSDMVIQEEQGEALVVALKALGMDRANTATVLICFLGERMPIQDIRELLFLHRNLSSSAAETLVDSWILMEAQKKPETTKAPRHAAQYEDKARINRQPRTRTAVSNARTSTAARKTSG